MNPRDLPASMRKIRKRCNRCGKTKAILETMHRCESCDREVAQMRYGRLAEVMA